MIRQNGITIQNQLEKLLSANSKSSQYTTHYLKVPGFLPAVLSKSKVLNLHQERRQVMLIVGLGHKGKDFLTQQLPEKPASQEMISSN